MDRFFKEAGDLDLMDSKNDSNNYFRPAGDLDSSNYIQDSTVFSKTDLKVDISSIKTNAELLKYFSDNWMSNGKKMTSKI